MPSNDSACPRCTIRARDTYDEHGNYLCGYCVSRRFDSDAEQVARKKIADLHWLSLMVSLMERRRRAEKCETRKRRDIRRYKGKSIRIRKA